MAQLAIRALIFYLMIALSLISLVTGIILYFWPHGPSAGRLLFLGLNKGTWSEIHTYSSLLAFIVVIIHIIVNRKLVKLYVKLSVGRNKNNINKIK